MDHRTATRMLTDFARGRLPETERADVQAHVDECPACTDFVAVAHLVREEAVTAGPGMFFSHPEPDALVRVALGLEASPDIAAHLDACPTCARESELTLQARSAGRIPWWEEWRQRWREAGAAPWRAAAMVATVAAIVLAVPVYRSASLMPTLRQNQARLLAERDEARARGDNLARQLEQVRAVPGQDTPAGGGINVLVLAGTTRDAIAETPRLAVRPGASVQPILAGFDLRHGGGLDRTVVLTVTPLRGGRGGWTHRCSAREIWDPVNQVVSVLVPAEALLPGNYEFSLREASATSPTYRAPFKVIAAAR